MFNAVKSPPNYATTIETHLMSVLPYFKEDLYFIYAGFYNEYSIFNRRISELENDVLGSEKKVIVFDGHEETITIASIIKIHNLIEHLNTLGKNLSFWYITGAMDGKESYIKFCNDKGWHPYLNLISYNFFETSLKHYNPHKPYYEGKRNKKYTCLNRVLRPHRCLLLNSLLHEHLVDESCYYSFYDTGSNDGGLNSIPKRFTEIYENIGLVKKLRLNFDPTRVNPNTLLAEDEYLYDETFFSVVTETLYFHHQSKHGDLKSMSDIFFTEKTFKPIAMVQPFIIVSRPNMLTNLRKLGYQTFHPYINEDYDLVTDDDLRMAMIVSEIKRLCQQSKEQWEEWIRAVKPIAEFNKKHLCR